MPIFPSSPSIGDYFNTTSGRFKWDGEKWIYERPSPAVGATGPTGDTGPQGAIPSTAVTGMVHAYVGTTAPSGWLFCDGTEVTQSAYPELFDALTLPTGIDPPRVYPYGGSGTTTYTPDLREKFIRGRGDKNSAIVIGSSAANTGAGGAHNHTTQYNANAGNTSSSGDHATYVNVIYGHNHGGNTGGPSSNDSSRWGNTNTYDALPSNGHSHGTYTYHSTEGNANNAGSHTHYHNAAGVSNTTHGNEESHTHAVNDPGSVTFAYIIKT